jgi:anaerobic ribonucleoside-triphosphate reductase activating protein
VWVQGCSIRCPGCFNPHLWAATGTPTTDTADFSADLVEGALARGVQGITLLGGEPFEQAAPVAEVSHTAHDAGLSVMTFTGYTLDELRAWSANRPDIAMLLAETDLLADGPYLADRPERLRPWVGSTNQGLHALTPLYKGLLEELPPDRLEVRVRDDGIVAVNGWADPDTLDMFLADLGRRVDRPRGTSINLSDTAACGGSCAS